MKKKEWSIFIENIENIDGKVNVEFFGFIKPLSLLYDEENLYGCFFSKITR